MSELLLRRGNRPNVPRAVDPDALGKIRNIVKSAHKWGGDGRRPKFRKIRRVLLTKHPEVIARGFGGNPNVAAAWIKNNWYRMRGMEPPPTRGRKKDVHAESQITIPWYEEVTAELEDGDQMELFCQIDAETESKDGLLWTPMLRTGNWATTPVVGRTGPWQCTKEDLEDIVTAFNEGAWENVTVPASRSGGSNHIEDPVDDNRGFVEAVAIRKHPSVPDRWVLWGGIRFTDPGTLELVRNGSVRGVSVRVGAAIHQESGKIYKRVLKHLCLTNNPFVNGLGAFREELAATRDPEKAKESVKLVSYEIDEDVFDDDPRFEALEELSAEAGDQAYDTNHDFDQVRSAIEEHLREYVVVDGDVADAPDDEESISWQSRMCVRGISPDTALVSWYGASDSQGWVVGYDVDEDGSVTIDPTDEWTKVEKQWVELTRYYSLVEPATEPDENDDPSKGGAQVEDKDKENGTPKNEELSLSRESLEAMIAEAITRDREQREPEIEATRTRVAELEGTNRRLDVERRVERLNAKKLPPAFVKTAEEMMLSLGTSDIEFQLTREVGPEDARTKEEYKVNFFDAIEELAASVPQSLDAVDFDAKNDGKSKPEGKTAEQIAEELAAELETGDVALVDADLV